MTNTKLEKRISENLQIPHNQVKNFMKAFSEELLNLLEEDSEVKLVGFGTFKKVDVPEHKVRNPKTGDTIISEACTKIKCKMSKVYLPK